LCGNREETLQEAIRCRIVRRFPKAASVTEVESMCELADGQSEFVIRRLLSAD
jgi:hypothetical protein